MISEISHFERLPATLHQLFLFSLFWNSYFEHVNLHHKILENLVSQTIFEGTFHKWYIWSTYFWKSHICVEAWFLPEGPLRETTEESAAHHFLIKIVSEALKITFGSSWVNFEEFRFSPKMTSLAGQKHKNAQRNLCRISKWTPSYWWSNIVDLANETHFRWYFEFWNQFRGLFLKWTHLRWSWFFARRGPRTNDRGECCAPFLIKNYLNKAWDFLWEALEWFQKFHILGACQPLCTSFFYCHYLGILTLNTSICITEYLRIWCRKRFSKVHFINDASGVRIFENPTFALKLDFCPKGPSDKRQRRVLRTILLSKLFQKL